MDNTENEQTNNQLLIRIDERQRAMNKTLDNVQLTLVTKVPNDDIFKEMRKQHDTLWEERGELKGYLKGVKRSMYIAISIAGTIISLITFGINFYFK